MAKLDEVFDASTVPEREEYLPVLPGQYVAMIVASEQKDTKAGGQMIVLELEIQEGEEAGSKLFERLNIKNHNQKAVDIAFRTLAEIVKAVGKTTIKDTDELHNKRMYVEVRVDPPQQKKDNNGALKTLADGSPDMYGPGNSIKKFLPMGVSTKTNVTNKEPEQKAETSTSAPWKRKSQ